jgi:hypothetical protein
MNTLLIRTQIIALLCSFALLIPAYAAFADHGDEETDESHATTVHAHEDDDVSITINPTVGPSVDIARIQKMQELLKALTQLVALLQLQKDMQHNADDHDHVEN